MRSYSRQLSFTLWAVLLVGTAESTLAQKVIVRQGTPSAVLELLKSELLPQRFELESANAKRALFTLDRGLRSQRREALVQVVPVTLELHVRFKQKADGWEVQLWAELVGDRGKRYEFRQRVQSPEELHKMQVLLDNIRDTLDERVVLGDTAN